MPGVFPKDIPRCQHRKTNGVSCGSPALHDKPYCYFHDRWREQHIDVFNGTPYMQNVDADLPILEDANSVQMALTKVFHMLLAGLLEPKFAKSLIYCLSIAAQNLRYCNFAPKDEEMGENAPARADQSLSQATWSTIPRPEKDKYSMSERELEDAAIAAKNAAEAPPAAASGQDVELAEADEDEEVDEDEEIVDIQAVAEEEASSNRGNRNPVRVRRVSRPSHFPHGFIWWKVQAIRRSPPYPRLRRLPDRAH